MMKILVAQIGARRHYAVPVAMQRAGLLESLHTDWCANRGLPRFIAAITPRHLHTRALRRLSDRRVPEIPNERIRTHLGYALQMARLRRSEQLSNYQYWSTANSAFAHRVVASGFGRADAVYAFNAAAAELFAEARARGLRTVLDQTMVPWRSVETMLAEERARWPNWESAAPDHTWQALADREACEWAFADLIICGSQCVVDAIAEAGGPAHRCRVVPYGFDLPPSAAVTDESGDAFHPGPLRVLYVGTVELRKGLPYLLEAAQSLDPAVAEFRIVGPLRVGEAATEELSRHTDVRGAVPRSAVSDHYRWADVMVLPTLAEGSANVCYEAMAHGVPVITTQRAGSVVRDGIDGVIVPPCSSSAIVGAVERLSLNRHECAEMASSAKARTRAFSRQEYARHLCEALLSSIDDVPSGRVA